MKTIKRYDSFFIKRVAMYFCVQVRVVVARHSIHAVDLHLRRDPTLLSPPQPRRLARTRDLLLNSTDYCPHRRASVSLLRT